MTTKKVTCHKNLRTRKTITRAIRAPSHHKFIEAHGRMKGKYSCPKSDQTTIFLALELI